MCSYCLDVINSNLITVPILDPSVFGNGEKIMRSRLEQNLHDALVVREDGLVTITEIHAPNLDVLIGR